MEKNIASLVAATPGAASIPQVYVAGCKDKSLKEGPNSTWTIVKALKLQVHPRSPVMHTGGTQEAPSKPTMQPTPVMPEQSVEQEDLYTYFLVSSAHCIREIIDCIKPYSSQEGEVVDRSVIFLSDDLQSLLSSNKMGDDSKDDSATKVRVVRVGFHKDFSTTSTILRNPEFNFVFLELEGKPSFDIEAIPIVGNVAALPANSIGNVARTALSGRVNGHGLVQVKSNYFLFVANFMERGCDGTVMFLSLWDGEMLPIGILKGTASVTQPGMRDQGAIVGFPKWTDVLWTNCVSQVCSIEGPILTLGEGGVIVTNKSATFKQRKLYLTLERWGRCDFTEETGDNLSKNDDYGYDLDWM